MAYVNYRELTHMVESDGLEATVANLKEALDTKQLSHRDFSLKALAEAFCGTEWVENMHPKRGSDSVVAQMMEADSNKYSQFSSITGQIFFNSVLEGYQDEELIFSKMIPERESDILEIEKIPGIARLGDEALIVNEGKEYPDIGVSEDYIEIAAKRKRGFKLSVTKEAIIGDRTGLLTSRLAEGGKFLGINKEKRLIDAVIDGNTGAASIISGGHRYHWKGTSYATYQSTTPWDNVTASTPLADWTDLDAGWQTLAALTDPYTGEPILVQPDMLIVTNAKAWTAQRILRATEARTHSGGYPTSGNPVEEVGPSPVTYMMNQIKMVTSRLFTARVSAASQDANDWYLANAKAWEYCRIWDITTAQRGAGTDAEFYRDVVMEFKASEMGTAATIDPRLTMRGDDS